MCKKLFIVLFITISLMGCGNSNTWMNNLDIDIPQHTTITDQSDFGWFNDGYDYKVLSFDKTNHDKIISNIKSSQQWNPLPLTPIIELLVYGNEAASSVVQDNNNNTLIPEIKNGYYYFLDRSDSQYCKIEDIKNFNPSSYNFTIAIYDTDNAKLYYYFLNT